jgi:hypothetical protein
MTPAAANDPAVVEAFAKASVQVEVKTPTGSLDIATLMPMLNPRLMPVPAMPIHGEYNDVADFEGLLMMHLQGSQRVFQHEVASFFKEP